MNYNNNGSYSGSTIYSGIPFGNYNLGSYDSGIPYNQPFILDFEVRNLDLFVTQGVRFYSVVVVRDTEGNPINLNGCTFSGSVARYHNSEKVCDLNVYPVDLGEGILALNVPPESTTKLNTSRFVYVVDMTFNTMTVNILRGQMMITNR